MTAAAVARAPGKVILLGEHAVVYGHAALAGALAQGVRVTAEPRPSDGSARDGGMRLVVPAWGLAVDTDGPEPLAQAFGAIARCLGVSSLPCDLSVTFELPTSSGLGSSAALAVAVARALAQAAGRTLTDGELLHAAMAAETVFHGRPSGIDAAVAARGGFGRFTRAAGLAPLPSRSDGRQLPAIPLVVGHTGLQRDTKGRVARVAQLVDERPDDTRARFHAIAALVERAAAAIADNDLASLGEAMNENGEHLAALEVSCPAIERMCELARAAGAVGAKLTGGGGGGCVIALAPGREEDVREAWRRAGYDSFRTTVGGAS